MKYGILSFLGLLLPMLISCQKGTQSNLVLLSEEIPAYSALVFGEGIISTDAFEFAITFRPKMDELFFTRRKPDAYNEIFTSKLIDGTWTSPQLAFFTPNE